MDTSLTALSLSKIARRGLGLLLIACGVAFPWVAHTQQVMVTITTGAAGDPLILPEYLVFDQHGNLFISDSGTSRVRRMDVATGAVTTVAGTANTPGSAGDNGPASLSLLNCPAGLALLSDGSLLIADPCANVVRRVSPGASGLVQGNPDEIIATFAGGGSPTNPSPAVITDVALASPWSLAADRNGVVYIGTQQLNDQGFVRGYGEVFAVNSANGSFSVVDAWPVDPESLAVDSANNLFIGSSKADLYDPIDCQSASGGGGDPDWLDFGAANKILGLALDGPGNLYAVYADGGQIFELRPGPTGFCQGLFGGRYGTTVSTVVGPGGGYSGDGGPPAAATLNEPMGIGFNAAGNLFIADTGNNVIRAIVAGAPTAMGGAISVHPLDQNGNPRTDITVSFSNVTAAGATAVVVGATGPTLPAGFTLATMPPDFFDIVTTAQFTGSVTVCVNPAPPGAQLLHFVNGAPDPGQTAASGAGVCIAVQSLSPFAVVKPLQQNQAPAITSANGATFQTGLAGSFTVTSSGTPTAALSATGTLPDGVSFADRGDGTGALSGTPTTGGSFPVTFTARNAAGSASQSFTLTVNQPAAITSPSAATFTAGTPGSFTVAATGFPAPTLTETGNLPSGLSWNAATGALSGTPTAGGVVTVSFSAHNGIGADATQSVTLTIDQAPAITSPTSVALAAGVAGSFTVTTSGYPIPSVAESGALPPGMLFADNHNGTGTLSGTPAGPGTFPISFAASNGVGSDAVQSFALTVSGSGSNGPIAAVNPASIDFGTVPFLDLVTRKVTVQNSGATTLNISVASLTLGPATDWDDIFFLNLCGSSLAPGRSCTMIVFYFANELGTKTATLSIRDNAPGSPHQVPIVGTTIKRGH